MSINQVARCTPDRFGTPGLAYCGRGRGSRRSRRGRRHRGRLRRRCRGRVVLECGEELVEVHVAIVLAEDVRATARLQIALELARLADHRRDLVGLGRLGSSASVRRSSSGTAPSVLTWLRRLRDRERRVAIAHDLLAHALGHRGEDLLGDVGAGARGLAADLRRGCGCTCRSRSGAACAASTSCTSRTSAGASRAGSAGPCCGSCICVRSRSLRSTSLWMYAGACFWMPRKYCS